MFPIRLYHVVFQGKADAMFGTFVALPPISACIRRYDRAPRKGNVSSSFQSSVGQEVSAIESRQRHDPKLLLTHDAYLERVNTSHTILSCFLLSCCYACNRCRIYKSRNPIEMDPLLFS